MPRDTAVLHEPDTIATDAEFALLTPRERLGELAKALRQQMPEGFRWYFPWVLVKETDCRSSGCAVGLACILWPSTVQIRPRFNVFPDLPDAAPMMCEVFGISRQMVAETFGNSADRYGALKNTNVTPQMVAADIEKHLEETANAA